MGVKRECIWQLKNGTEPLSQINRILNDDAVSGGSACMLVLCLCARFCNLSEGRQTHPQKAQTKCHRTPSWVFFFKTREIYLIARMVPQLSAQAEPRQCVQQLPAGA